MSKQIIDEGMHPEKEWFEQAGKQTTETLMGFINHVMNDYEHDYGTVVHAVAACALAAAYAANNSDSGGITGFQAGCVMWDFIRGWQYPTNECGLKLLNYDNMLYPQYDYRFGKTLSKGVWESLQKKAAKNLEDKKPAADIVIEHWKSIVNGVVPFGYVVEE